MAQLIPAPPAHDHTAVPIYKLYGYGNVWTVADPMFCETIGAQQQLHKWHVAAHKHAGLFQALFIEAGGLTAILDGHAHELAAGCAVLVPQMAVHEFMFRPDTVGYILTMTSGLLQQLCTRFDLALGRLADPLILEVGDDVEDRHAMSSLRRLEAEYHSPYSAQRGPMLETLLSVVLVWIHRRCHFDAVAAARPDPGSRHLARYARMIEEHYREHHRVSWYASRIGVTAAHLNAIAQALAGKSALQLIHERLMLEARRELVYTARPVAVISDYLGFSDPSYFTRFFTRQAQLSPRVFRRRESTAEG